MTDDAVPGLEGTLATLLDLLPLPAILVHRDGKVVWWSRAASTELGFEEPSGVVSIYELAHPDDRGLVESFLAELEGDGLPGKRREWRAISTDGTWRYFEVAGTDVRYGPDVDGVLLCMCDVSAHMATEKQLFEEAMYDPLTGLASRRLLEDRLAQNLRRRRPTSRKVGVLAVHIGEVSELDAEVGVDAGDELLVELAARLRNCVRADDTAALLSREELSVMLVDVLEDQIAVISARILETMAESFVVANREIGVLATIGASVGSSEMDSPELVLEQARDAMEEARLTEGCFFMRYQSGMPLPR